MKGLDSMTPPSMLRSRRHFLGAASVGSCIVIVACGGSTTAPGTHAASTSGDDGGTTMSNGADSSAGNPSPSDDSGSSGTGGEDSGSVATGPVDGASCPATGAEVVMIGDSYFALSETTSPPAGEITEHLQSLASAAGALASGDTYRHYFASGANMGTYGTSTITPIPQQFAQGVSANPDIKYVIMDGGGNDILLENTDCILAAAGSSISDTCKAAVQTAITAATTLFQSMKTAGVEKVIYFFYPHLPTTEFPSVNTMLDYAFPLVQAACQNAPLPCYFIDTRPAFNGNDASYIGPDNIHPTAAGSDVIAGLIWDEMKDECVALSP
jgi:lysophospholipase L1-like esterase